MARAEYQGCPPGVVRGAAAHPSIASALNHTVRLPRRRRLASYAGQFVTLCVRLGMWWRRSWFSLKGKAGTPGSGQGQPPTPGRPRAPSSGSVHQGVAKRTAKKQQMRWNKATMQPFLDVRTVVLNDMLEDAFRQRYPGFRPANDDQVLPAVA